MFRTRRGGMETRTPDKKPGVQGQCSSQLSYTPNIFLFLKVIFIFENIYIVYSNNKTLLT